MSIEFRTGGESSDPGRHPVCPRCHYLVAKNSPICTKCLHVRESAHDALLRREGRSVVLRLSTVALIVVAFFILALYSRSE